MGYSPWGRKGVEHKLTTKQLPTTEESGKDTQLSLPNSVPPCQTGIFAPWKLTSSQIGEGGQE